MESAVAGPKPRRGSALSTVLRREQFTVVASRSVGNGICSLGCFLAVAATFWADASHGFLLAAFTVLALLHGVAILRSRAWLSGPMSNLSEGQVMARVVVAALVVLTWSSLAVLMPAASADQRQLIIYVFAGLTTSAILIAPILPAALAVAAIPTMATLLVMPFLHQTITGQHAVMVVLFFGMTVVAIRSQNRNFRARVESEAAVRDQKDTVALLLRDFEENACDLLWEVDARWMLRQPSARLATFLDRSPDALSGLDVRTLLDGDPSRDGKDLARLRDAVRRREPFRELKLPVVFDGRPYWFSLSGRPVRDADGGFAGYRGVATDNTDAQRSTDRISYLARYDSMTGLPNRILFADTLDATAREGGPFALLCLDLDGFKPVNDTYGHGVGDELLVMVAARLRACLRGGDTVARLGGDEFAVLLPGAGEREAVLLAERLIEVTGRLFAIRDLRVGVSLGVGIVSATAGMTCEQLLQAGDVALYASKRRARGCWSLFNQDMATAAQERHLLQVDLRDAIGTDGLDLAFQPILNASDRQIGCVEALVRWRHPRLGPIPPDRFIPLAEDSGLVVPLGAWVLRRACREATRWPGDVRVAVNLSPVQLRQADLIPVIDAILLETGLPPHRLEIEITESVFLEEAEATIGRLRAMRERGIRISLDDFGTGYSSLSYLRSFPFDKVKIDRSFVQDLCRSEQALAIIRAIIGMAGSLGIGTTGEGVETDQQAAMLDSAGCEEFQGFLFGRPCPADQIAALLDGRPAAAAFPRACEAVPA